MSHCHCKWHSTTIKSLIMDFFQHLNSARFLVFSTHQINEKYLVSHFLKYDYFDVWQSLVTLLNFDLGCWLCLFSQFDLNCLPIPTCTTLNATILMLEESTIEKFPYFALQLCKWFHPFPIKLTVPLSTMAFLSRIPSMKYISES